ncbi:hypothetical protein CSUI_001895 [Cystoisospora suis]|uniref:Uncharacterized protein n=1 Tax=Cystoisospora suis TaxID=483139 RepID=A0A2C6L6S6_9APIC|nr:hypothetical protein CSUI_001895 [Cystoisospora suis]
MGSYVTLGSGWHGGLVPCGRPDGPRVRATWRRPTSFLISLCCCVLLTPFPDPSVLSFLCSRTAPSIVFAQESVKTVGGGEDDSDFNKEIAEIIQQGIVFPGKFDFDEAYDEAKKESETHLIWDIHHVDEKLLVTKLHERMERYLFKAYLDVRRASVKLQRVPIVGNARLVHFLRSLLTRDRILTRKSDSELSAIFKERPRLFQWIPDLQTGDHEATDHDEL